MYDLEYIVQATPFKKIPHKLESLSDAEVPSL